MLREVNQPMTIETLEHGASWRQATCWSASMRAVCVHTDLEVIHRVARLSTAPSCSGTRAQAWWRQSAARSSRSSPGDHVICSWNPHCGHCYYCERDLPILCEPFSRNQPRGFAARRQLAHVASRFHCVSLFGNFDPCAVHCRSRVGAIAVPAEIPFDRACIVGCGVMTGVGAAVRKAKVAAGSSVVVIGLRCGRTERAARVPS